MNATRSCVLYVRKSTDREDKQILSIPAQFRELREFAARSGLTITRELTESCSARKPGRPVFSQLLKDVAAGRVERILSWRLDRLARNPVDGGHLIYYLGDNALKELVTPEGTYTGAGDSKFMRSVLFGAATKMTDDLAAGVRRGNKEVLKSGRIPWRAPMGYVKVRGTTGYRGAGRAVPDRKRFALVQRLWSEMLSGTLTVAELWRRAVNDWGLQISISQLYALLRNPFYAGLIRSAAGVFDGEHQPMVTRPEFDRVQALIAPERSPRPFRRRFAYAGLLRCGRCGRMFVGEQHVKPSKLVFKYYRCGRRHQGHEVCRAPAAREEAVTGDVDRAFATYVLPEHVATWTREALDYWMTQQKGMLTERIAGLESDLLATERSVERLTDLVVSGALKEADFVRRRDDAEAHMSQLRHAIQEPEAELAAWRALVEEAITAGTRVATVVDCEDADERRAFLAQVCANLVVTDRITKPSLRYPYTLLEGASEIVKAASATCANPLPSPETVLSERKSARPRDGRERALLTWWTKVLEVRTQSNAREPTRLMAA
jgi:DNA invertase Pin-like site-specific DNA recombinase